MIATLRRTVMSDKPDDESAEIVERWLRWLREEAARISVRTEDEEIKSQIASSLKQWCEIVSNFGGHVEEIEKLCKHAPRSWEFMLNPPPPKGIARFPIEGRPLPDQWRELCLWLTVRAHQLIGETDAPELKSDILERLRALTREGQRPLTMEGLCSRVTAFTTTVNKWSRARTDTLVPKPGWPRS
jgi:hypothetical protein